MYREVDSLTAGSWKGWGGMFFLALPVSNIVRNYFSMQFLLVLASLLALFVEKGSV